MRLIDADKLKEEVNNKRVVGRFNTIQLIDDAPTVYVDEYEKAYNNGYHLGFMRAIEIPQGKWIPASEKLPDDMQKVLVWFEYYRYGDYNCMYQTYGFGYVCDGKWSSFINGESGWQDARIIAWMPLPEAYKEAVYDTKQS